MATSEYGVQDDGSFDKKPIDVIREDVKQQFKNEIGQDIELRPSSPITQVINATAIEISKQWDAAEAAYYASFYEDSFGEQLDKQLALAGFRRQSLRGATGEVTFTSEGGASEDINIPEGTVVTTERTDTRPAIPFETTETVTLFRDETSITVGIEALEPWQTDVDRQWLGEETNLESGTVTVLQDPIAGIDTVTNSNPTGDQSLDFTEGRDRETDAEFKNRYEASLAVGGKATQDAIRAEMFQSDADIDSVNVEEIHDTDADQYGARVTVLAPTVPDDVIAQAIFDSMAAGMDSYGAESGTATSESGDEYIENFDRATSAAIEVDITINTGPTYPTDGDSELTDRLIRYVGGETTDGTNYPGLGIGETVVYDQLFRRVMNQQGVVEAEMTIGPQGGTLNEDNITTAEDEAATLAVADVTITEA